MPIHQVPDSMFHLFFALIRLFAAQNAASLPDASAVWERLRPNLLKQYEPTDLMKGYTYDLTSIVEEFDGKNRLKQTERLEYEVYNFSPGPFRKLVNRNGADLSEKELQKENEALERFAKQPPGIQEWTRNRWLKQLPEVINDLPNAFDIVIAGREILNDRSTLVVQFKPKQNQSHARQLERYFSLRQAESHGSMKKMRDYNVSRSTISATSSSDLAFF